MPVIAKGQVVIWEGASLWMLAGVQDLAELSPHAHHAIQLTFLLEGAYEIGLADSGLSGPVTAVGSDVPHRFRARGAVAFLFVAPESAAGRAISANYLGGRAWADLTAPLAGELEELRRCFAGLADERELLRTGQGVTARLAGAATAPLPDARVLSMISYAQNALTDNVTLKLAAAEACLSDSRARHLFAMHTGLPFKSFVLWLRLQRALALYVDGRSLTEAAHGAGFADSAHFSRTFRRTFGLPANQLRFGPLARVAG